MSIEPPTAAARGQWSGWWRCAGVVAVVLTGCPSDVAEVSPDGGSASGSDTEATASGPTSGDSSPSSGSDTADSNSDSETSSESTTSTTASTTDQSGTTAGADDTQSTTAVTAGTTIGDETGESPTTTGTTTTDGGSTGGSGTGGPVYPPPITDCEDEELVDGPPPQCSLPLPGDSQVDFYNDCDMTDVAVFELDENCDEIHVQDISYANTWGDMFSNGTAFRIRSLEDDRLLAEIPPIGADTDVHVP